MYMKVLAKSGEYSEPSVRAEYKYDRNRSVVGPKSSHIPIRWISFLGCDDAFLQVSPLAQMLAMGSMQAWDDMGVAQFVQK